HADGWDSFLQKMLYSDGLLGQDAPAGTCLSDRGTRGGPVPPSAGWWRRRTGPAGTNDPPADSVHWRAPPHGAAPASSRPRPPRPETSGEGPGITHPPSRHEDLSSDESSSRSETIPSTLRQPLISPGWRN